MTSETSVSETGSNNSFLILITGTIEYAVFPLGPESSQVFCKFEIVAGTNWQHVSGINKGISQAAMPKDGNDKIVFNIPFQCIYRSGSPFGWPQVLVSIYGKNRWSVETTIGYCWGHLPIIASRQASITQPIRIPKDTTVMGQLSNWVKSRNAELKNADVLLDSYSNEMMSMETNGELKLTLRTLYRGPNEDCGEPYGNMYPKLNRKY